MGRAVLAIAAFAALVQPLWGQGCCMSKMGGSGGSTAAGLSQLAASQQLANQQLAAMLQEAQVAAFVQRVAKEDEDTLRKRCRSQNPLERYAAALAIGQGDLSLKKELSALRTDPHPAVRQAAGRSLLLIAQRSRQALRTQPSPTAK